MATKTPRTVPDATAEIAWMVGRLAKDFQPLRILLFGSRARGDARPESDIDFLVVLPEVQEPHRTVVAMLGALSERRLPVDIVLTTPQEIAQRGHLVGSVLRPALREGKV